MPRKVFKMNPLVAKHAETTESNPAMAAAAADTVADEIAARDKCSLRFVQPVALRHKFLSNQIRRSRFIAVIASKNHETVKSYLK